MEVTDRVKPTPLAQLSRILGVHPVTQTVKREAVRVRVGLAVLDVTSSPHGRNIHPARDTRDGENHSPERLSELGFEPGSLRERSGSALVAPTAFRTSQGSSRLS